MVLPVLGRWSSMGRKFFTYERIYHKGKWSPFCKVRRRHNKNNYEVTIM